MTFRHVPFSKRGFLGPPQAYGGYWRGYGRRSVDGDISSNRTAFYPGMHERNRVADDGASA